MGASLAKELWKSYPLPLLALLPAFTTSDVLLSPPLQLTLAGTLLSYYFPLSLLFP